MSGFQNASRAAEHHSPEYSQLSVYPFIVGYMLNWWFLGILCTQCWTYYIAFPNDRRAVKIAVYAVLVMEMVQTALPTRDAYLAFMKRMGEGPMQWKEDIGRTLWFDVPITAGIVSSIGQGFFAFRLYILSSRVVLSAIILLLSLLSLGASLYFGIRLKIVNTFGMVLKIADLRVSSVLWATSGALCDIVIVISMVHYLRQRYTGLPSTARTLTKLIRLTIETGLLTATPTIMSALFFAGFRKNVRIFPFFIIPAILISKLYAVTMMAILNSRLKVSGGRYDEVDTLSMTCSLRFKKSGGGPGSLSTRVGIDGDSSTTQIGEAPDSGIALWRGEHSAPSLDDSGSVTVAGSAAPTAAA